MKSLPTLLLSALLSAVLFLLLPGGQAQAGQWFTTICAANSAFEGIPLGGRKNLTDPLQGLPTSIRALECSKRDGYAIGNNFSRSFLGLEQTSKAAYKTSLAWYWEELPQATVFQTPNFIPGGIYMRTRNGSRTCLWLNTEFDEKLAYSCLDKKGLLTSSKYGKLLRPLKKIVVKKNKQGKIISRSGFYDIVPATLNKINNIVFGNRAYSISLGLGIWCLNKKGCSAKGKPQIIWPEMNFKNKDVLPPFINPAGYNAIEFPESVENTNPWVRVAVDGANSLAGEIKCPLEEQEMCISSYGTQKIGATDQPLGHRGAGLYSLTLGNNLNDGSTSGPFVAAPLSGSNAAGWLIGEAGSSLYNSCTSSGFNSTCSAPPWGILNFEMRSEINDQAYNLNGPNRLRVCAQDRFQASPSSGNQAGLNSCVVADQSFVLDNQGPSGEITLPQDQGSSPYSGTILFSAEAQDIALGVASLQFQVQETDFLGNPLGPVVSVGPLLDTATAPGVSGTYTTEIDSSTLDNGIYRVLAEVKDKEARTLGTTSASSFTTVLESDYLVYIDNP